MLAHKIIPLQDRGLRNFTEMVVQGTENFPKQFRWVNRERNYQHDWLTRNDEHDWLHTMMKMVMHIILTYYISKISKN